MSTNTYVAIESRTLTTTTPSVTFTSIPQTYTDLVLVVTGANTGSEQGIATQVGNDSVDTGANYGVVYMLGSGTGTGSAGGFVNNTNITAGRMDGNPSVSIINYMNYSNTTTFKSVLSRGNNGTYAIMHEGTWRNTAAINTISVFNLSSVSFAAGCTFTLYGIKAWVPEVSPKASGGYVSQDSTYWYHAFPFSGAFVPSQSLTADVLVIAGGGGSAHAGGGAGGLCFYASQSLTTTNYAITVGGGGTRGSNPDTRGGQGTNSQFAALTAAVGGGGGAAYASSSITLTGGNGGSGGGGSARDTNSTGAGGSPTSGQGFAGGSASFALSPGAVSGGGGGGAGGAGGEASNATSTNGNGGIGSSAYSSWGAATNFGENVAGTYYFAGGGRGNRNFLYGTPGFGAAGMNRGGGANADSAGGSGIVIVRYAK